MNSNITPKAPKIGDAFHSLVALDGSFLQQRPTPEMEIYLRGAGLIECSPISRMPIRTAKGEELVAAAMEGVSPTGAFEG